MTGMTITNKVEITAKSDSTLKEAIQEAVELCLKYNCKASLTFKEITKTLTADTNCVRAAQNWFN